MTNTLEETQSIINNKLNIKIKESDLKMKDLDLYLKIYNEYTDKNNVEDFDELKLEITREINLARDREICESCMGRGLINNVKCLICNGHGHLSQEGT